MKLDSGILLCKANLDICKDLPIIGFMTSCIDPIQ